MLGYPPMRSPTPFSLSLACAALGALSALGCGGAVNPGPGSGGGGGSSSGSESSSGVSSSGLSSSGVSSSGVSSSSGFSSSSSGVTPIPSPQCSGLELPAIALLCPDGSGASPYYVWNGSQCVVAYQCPSSPPSSSSSSGVGGSSSGLVEPPPPVCDFALPDICEACPNGETICAHYAIQNGSCIVEICPPTSVTPVGGACEQGARCQPSTGCGTASSSGGCSTSCNCDYTGTYQCTTNCGVVDPPPPPPPTNTCAQGQACQPGAGCGGGPDVYGCYANCTCLSSSFTLDCTYNCGFGGVDGG